MTLVKSYNSPKSSCAKKKIGKKFELMYNLADNVMVFSKGQYPRIFIYIYYIRMGEKVEFYIRQIASRVATFINIR